MASVISTLLFMPVWGKIADKYGTVFVLRMTGSFIFTVPLLWLAVPQILNSNPGILLPVILCIEVFSGFIWAGFNLATATFVFHAVTKERLVFCWRKTEYKFAWRFWSVLRWEEYCLLFRSRFSNEPILFVFF
jgi:MFS family permease